MRWAVVIDHVWEAQGFAAVAKKIADYYSAEDIKRWQDEIGRHLDGV